MANFNRFSENAHFINFCTDMPAVDCGLTIEDSRLFQGVNVVNHLFNNVTLQEIKELTFVE
jgi:hypothetical protein